MVVEEFSEWKTQTIKEKQTEQLKKELIRYRTFNKKKDREIQAIRDERNKILQEKLEQTRTIRNLNDSLDLLKRINVDNERMNSNGAISTKTRETCYESGIEEKNSCCKDHGCGKYCEEEESYEVLDSYEAEDYDDYMESEIVETPTCHKSENRNETGKEDSVENSQKQEVKVYGKESQYRTEDIEVKKSGPENRKNLVKHTGVLAGSRKENRHNNISRIVPNKNECRTDYYKKRDGTENNKENTASRTNRDQKVELVMGER